MSNCLNSQRSTNKSVLRPMMPQSEWVRLRKQLIRGTGNGGKKRS